LRFSRWLKNILLNRLRTFWRQRRPASVELIEPALEPAFQMLMLKGQFTADTAAHLRQESEGRDAAALGGASKACIVAITRRMRNSALGACRLPT
jgi:hypothetical protein